MNAAPHGGRAGRVVPGVVLGAALLVLSACQPPDKREYVQVGARGTGMEIGYRSKTLNAAFHRISIPAPIPPAGPSPPGPLPWKNVQVLNDITVGELNRTMVAMSTWVAGTGNCAYCHNVANFAADTLDNGRTLYTKITARRMLQMTRRINGQYASHVANTGVTCYTCHMGKPLPNGLWFYTDENQLQRYYLDGDGLRVVSHTVAPTPGNRSSVKQTEWTYALMINISQSLGVNCTYCHNSRQFASWEQSPPRRVTALRAVNMLRDINVNYLSPLRTVFPAVRKGVMGDAPKAQCLTCHNGVYKPLYAAQMVKYYPALWGRTDWNGTPFPGLNPVRVDSARIATDAATDGARTAAQKPAASTASGSRTAGPGAGK